MSKKPQGQVSPTVPPQASSSPPVSSYSGQFYSYLYNSAASVTNALSGETKLADEVPCFVNGLCYKGTRTTQWATEAVRICCPYFTYRKSLPAVLPNGGDHDAGWGCMIRTGQMMMCRALRKLYRCDQVVTEDPLQFAMFQRVVDDPTPRQSSALLSPTLSPRGVGNVNAGAARTAPNFLLNLDDNVDVGDARNVANGGEGTFCQWIQEQFMDTPSALFGLYRFVAEGAKLGVSAGSWFSPTVLARSLASIGESDPDLNEKLCIIPAIDQSVSQDRMSQTLLVEERSILLLVPLMLGLGSVGGSYEQVILRLLELPMCIGIVGGKPQKSLYFVGHQREQVFFLDPHVVQQAFVSRSSAGKPGGPRGTTGVSTLDPNLLACFFFENDDVFLQWCDEMSVINKMGEFPIITIQSGNANQGPSSLTVTGRSSPKTAVDDCDFDESDDDDDERGRRPTKHDHQHIDDDDDLL